MSLRPILQPLNSVAVHIAVNAPFRETAGEIALLLERLTPELRYAILHYVPQQRRLELVAAPSHSETFCVAHSSVPVEAGAGMLAAAGSSRSLVVARSSNELSPLPGGHRCAEDGEALGGWAMPVLDGRGRLLGVAAAYSYALRDPTQAESEVLRTGASLILAAHQRASDATRLIRCCSAEMAMADALPDPVFIHRGGDLLYLNVAAQRMFEPSSAPNQPGQPVAELLDPAIADRLSILRAGFAAMYPKSGGQTSLAFCADSVPMNFMGEKATLTIASFAELPGQGRASGQWKQQRQSAPLSIQTAQSVAVSLVAESQLIGALSRLYERADAPIAMALHAAQSGLLAAASELRKLEQLQEVCIQTYEELIDALASLATRVDQRLALGATCWVPGCTYTAIPATAAQCFIEIASDAAELALGREGISHMEFLLCTSPEGISLTVTDNGMRADEHALGAEAEYRAMRARAAAAGATLAVGYAHDHGTTLVLHRASEVAAMPAAGHVDAHPAANDDRSDRGGTP
jgi:hypothetical protein